MVHTCVMSGCGDYGAWRLAYLYDQPEEGELNTPVDRLIRTHTIIHKTHWSSL